MKKFLFLLSMTLLMCFATSSCTQCPEQDSDVPISCCDMMPGIDLDSCELYNIGWEHGHQDGIEAVGDYYINVGKTKGYTEAADWYMDQFDKFISSQKGEVKNAWQAYKDTVLKARG